MRKTTLYRATTMATLKEKEEEKKSGSGSAEAVKHDDEDEDGTSKLREDGSGGRNLTSVGETKRSRFLRRLLEILNVRRWLAANRH
jgi:hypothetical protein